MIEEKKIRPANERKICFERLNNAYQDEKMMLQIKQIIHTLGVDAAYEMILSYGKGTEIDNGSSKSLAFRNIVYNAMVYLSEQKN